MPGSVLGLDIGGANLKAANTDGVAHLQAFELWKTPAGLADALGQMIAGLPPFDALAVTMTGELCDCFESKRDGVRTILEAVAPHAGGKPVRVWQVDGHFVDPTTALERPHQTAASNWLALATFAGRYVPEGPALVIDVGSTTSDIVPLLNGVPQPKARTDPDRLRSRELVYTGVRRTPLCSLLGTDAAAELFATTLDVYLILGRIAENADDKGTADGRPATRAAAHGRLARMLCADLETCTEADRRNLAMRICNRQWMVLRQAIEQVAATLAEPVVWIVLSGSGEFLARAALEGSERGSVQLLPAERIFSMNEMIGPEISQSACAYAVAMLASEQAHAQP